MPASVIKSGAWIFGISASAAYPAYEAELKKAGKTVTVHTYEGCQHGFHNDTTQRFDPENARVAWIRTLDFFRQHLT